LGNSIQFPCVNLEIGATKKIVDIDVVKEESHLYLILIDFTKHYNESQHLVQEKNEYTISKHKLAYERGLSFVKEEFKNKKAQICSQRFWSIF
jgi:hypothetical protein